MQPFTQRNIEASYSRTGVVKQKREECTVIRKGGVVGRRLSIDSCWPRSSPEHDSSYPVGRHDGVELNKKCEVSSRCSAPASAVKSGNAVTSLIAGVSSCTPLCPPCVRQPTHSQPSPHWQVPVASLQPGSTIWFQKYDDGDSVGVSSSFPSLGLSATGVAAGSSILRASGLSAMGACAT
jgi:hypothetical protein